MSQRAAAAGPLARPARLPAGYQPVAGLDRRALGQPSAPDLGQSRLAVWQPAGDGRFSRVVGPAVSVVGIHGSTVAWRSAAARCNTSSEGELHITDTTTGTDRVLAAPKGQCGFDGGGAFSPDGSRLAAFVDAAPTAGPNVQLTCRHDHADPTTWPTGCPRR